MKSDPCIIVACDSCGEEEEIQLTATASGGYDERAVDAELEGLGWTIDGDRTYCHYCSWSDDEDE